MDFTRVEYIGVSSDEEAKLAGEAKQVKVTFVFKNFTPDDLVDRLIVSNSPRVSVQAALRKLEVMPKEYTYNVTKAGARAVVTEDTVINNMSEEAAKEAIAKLRAKYGIE